MKSDYKKTPQEFWTGRSSKNLLYLHEKVTCLSINEVDNAKNKKTIALLGYACDIGIKRNQGRLGAVDGPKAIRKYLAKLPNHLAGDSTFIDAGTHYCIDDNLEALQDQLAESISLLLHQNILPIVIGGGHDIAYGHFKGIRKYLGDKKIGIINFDAHFDLRLTTEKSNSGTPFYQISQDARKEQATFNYLCLGIRRDANDSSLFKTADALQVKYLECEHFNMHYLEHVQLIIMQFIEDVDYIYTTIDLDGFSSAYAPGVSAPSPIGFTPTIVLESLKIILDSQKLISLDIAEMNPKYDIDGQTAKLAASLIHYVMNRV